MWTIYKIIEKCRFIIVKKEKICYYKVNKTEEGGIKMTNSEIKKWSKEKIKGKWFKILPAIFVASILTGLTVGGGYSSDTGTYSSGYSLGWIFYFVQIGLVAYMVKFINDEQVEFKDIFNYSKDFGRAIGAVLLQAIYVLLFLLLLIIPGIIKLIAYSLVPYLMADAKYDSLGLKELLTKSEEMMNGHKMDYFMLNLSFIGWHFLAIFTLFILEIWIVPYQTTANTKFLNDIKLSNENGNQ